MTVTELIKKLQDIEAQGKGNLETVDNEFWDIEQIQVVNDDFVRLVGIYHD